MNYMYKIKEMLCKELKEYAEMEKLTASDLEMIHKLSDTIKNLDKIEMLEDESGYSNHYPDYDERGSSYARRGMHYVKGHYSRDYDNNDHSERYDRGYDRRYSMDKAKDHMMSKLGAMLEDADPRAGSLKKGDEGNRKGVAMTAEEPNRAEQAYKEAMDIFPALHKYQTDHNSANLQKLCVEIAEFCQKVYASTRNEDERKIYFSVLGKAINRK